MADEKRLIDANALSEKIGNMKFEITNNRGGYKYCNEDEKNEWDKLDSFDSLVCDAPTVDAVEVVHAMWETQTDGTHFCTHCGCDAPYKWDDIDRSFINSADDVPDRPSNYCPNCGARMLTWRNTHE